MKRVILTLSLAAAVALLLGVASEARAMTASQAVAVQAAQQAVAHPGHFGHHGHGWGHHHPPFVRPWYGPYAPGPVVVYGPPRYYPPYYGYPGGIVVGGRGWRVGVGF
jgi:hypothetical protein